MESKTEKNLILQCNFEKFLCIISKYFHHEETIEKVKDNLGRENSSESMILDRLVSYYSEAQYLFERNQSIKKSIDKAFNIPNSAFYCDQPFSIEDLAHLCKNKNILIKPNFVSLNEYPETSSLDIIIKIIDKLQENASTITIGDGPSLFFDSKPVINKWQALLPNVKVNDFNQGNYIDCVNPEMQILRHIKIHELVYSSDIIINLCNFKQHDSFLYSGARKNMMGVLSPGTRIYMHKIDQVMRNQALNELSSMFKHQLIVMDCRKLMLFAQQTIYGGIACSGPGILYSIDPQGIDSYMIDYLSKGEKYAR